MWWGALSKANQAITSNSIELDVVACANEVAGINNGCGCAGVSIFITTVPFGPESTMLPSPLALSVCQAQGDRARLASAASSGANGNGIFLVGNFLVFFLREMYG